MEDIQVLCASSVYEKKYYLNPDYDLLPQQVKDELKIMCVLFTEEFGGILTLRFDDEGNLYFETKAKEDDVLYDDIGSGLKISRLRKEKADLFESLELFYRVFVLGETEEQ